MSERHTVDNINSDQLDALYAQLAKVRALRDDLRATTGARWIADALDNILDPAPPDGTCSSDGPETQPNNNPVPCPACRRADEAGLGSSEQHGA